MNEERGRLFYTVEQVAEELSIHQDTARRLLRTGEIEGAKLGGEWRVSREDLLDYYERNKTKVCHYCGEERQTKRFTFYDEDDEEIHVQICSECYREIAGFDDFDSDSWAPEEIEELMLQDSSEPSS